MQALILNSGMGSRMEELTENNPKSLVKLKNKTILENQIDSLISLGINDIIITTGYMQDKIKEFINDKYSDLKVDYVYNPLYSSTNYIYSMYLAKDIIKEDFILMHGDLYFNKDILKNLIEKEESSVVIDRESKLPKEDFKARLDNRNMVSEISINIFGENTYSLQPLYKLKYEDWLIWLEEIKVNYRNNDLNVYAEDALNRILDDIDLNPLDIEGDLCMEIDNKLDLKSIKEKLGRCN